MPHRPMLRRTVDSLPAKRMKNEPVGRRFVVNGFELSCEVKDGLIEWSGSADCGRHSVVNGANSEFRVRAKA